jgi:lipoprotein LprG
MNDLTSQPPLARRLLCHRPSAKWSVATVAAASLFASVLTGCGGDQKSAQTTSASASGPPTTSAGQAAGQVDAAKLQAECAKTTETLQSVHVMLVATGLDNLPMQTVDASVMSNPQGQTPGASAVGKAKVRTKQGEPYQDFDFMVKDRTMYTKSPDGSYQSVGPAEQIYDPGVVLDQKLGLANIVKSVQNPKAEGNEPINGVNTVKISGTIAPDVVDKVVPQLGAGVSAPMPITLYIQDVGPQASQTNTSAPPSDQPSPGQGPNLVRFQVTRDQGNVQVTMSEWGKPVSIPNP